jgi:NADP-dependent 3-hydroxy acid dehydrogenase YdfG
VIGGGSRRLAVVSGGSRGIGRAIALRLAADGHDVLVVARGHADLDTTVAEARRSAGPGSGSLQGLAVDVASDAERGRIAAAVAGHDGGLGVLVHSAGTTIRGRFEDATLDAFDEQYRANVRAPFALTRELLPHLERARGQVVVIGSTAALVARATASQYAATQAALRAVATALRDEVNPRGIRVTTVFVGRAASPRQEEIHRFEGRDYHPEQLLQPDDVASIVMAALALPRTAEVTELTIRNMRDL